MLPIFICGHIKTGTSLLSSLLDNHPELTVFPEELFLYSKVNKLKKQKKLTYSAFWNLFFSDIQINRMFSKESIGLFGNVDYSNFDAEKFRASCINKTSDVKSEPIDIVAIYKIIFDSYYKLHETDTAQKWVEKTPMNELNFFDWYSAFKNLKFIYIKRNPLDTYSSIKKKRSIEKVSYPVLNFILNFKTSQKVAFRLQKRYPDRFKIIEYEYLISKPKECMENLSSFLEIKFNDSLLSPSKYGNPWYGNSMFEKKESNVISKSVRSNERNSLISSYEKRVIKNFILMNKSPIFEIDFAKQSFKKYLKLVLINFRVFLFVNKIIKI